MKKKNKFLYLYVVQGYYGSQHGWEDLCSSEDRKEALHDLKAYQENEKQYCHRLIFRRELND